MVERLIVLHGDRAAAIDGIRDHTRELAAALARSGPRVAVCPIDTRGRAVRRWARSWRRLTRLGPEDAVVIQYSPFCWGRRGFAPGLLAMVAALRARPRRPTIALLVHEPFVPMSSWRWALMGAWQRLQLALLRLAADVVFVSIEPWARRLAGWLPKRPSLHLPVGSNFPDARGRREGERERLGVAPETLVLACLGRDHPAFLRGHVVGAVNAVAPLGRPLQVLNLGGEAPALEGVAAGIAVDTPGFLESEEFAARLAAADIFLLPTVDGASTRRGSLMAALQHGLPVLATEGELTDAVLRRAGAGPVLTAVADEAGFRRAAVRLAGDAEARAAVGAAGRRLYERDFDWSVTARRLLAALPAR
jgi:glycosyltransferase involved in cell wall biosynthesis